MDEIDDFSICGRPFGAQQHTHGRVCLNVVKWLLFFPPKAVNYAESVGGGGDDGGKLLHEAGTFLSRFLVKYLATNGILTAHRKIYSF